MAADYVVKITQRYLEEVRKADLPVEGLVLYGSYARGDARAESDIDLLVLLNDSLSEQDIARVWTRLEHLTLGVDSRIETWPVTARRFETDEVSPLMIAARREGIRIAT